MKKILYATVCALAVMSLSSFVFAAATEVIEFPASMGKITFNHKQHQDRLQDCTKCHAAKEGGKIEGFGKDIAHNTCKSCHASTGKGPTSCKECHVK